MDEKYFVAKITTDMVDTETGKVKKQREEKLVKGYSPIIFTNTRFLRRPSNSP